MATIYMAVWLDMDKIIRDSGLVITNGLSRQYSNIKGIKVPSKKELQAAREQVENFVYRNILKKLGYKKNYNSPSIFFKLIPQINSKIVLKGYYMIIRIDDPHRLYNVLKSTIENLVLQINPYAFQDEFVILQKTPPPQLQPI